MTIQSIKNYGFRYIGGFKTREELDAGIEFITDCLLVLFVIGLTAIFVVSFSLL